MKALIIFAMLLLTSWPTLAGPKKVLTFFTRPFKDPLWDVGEFVNAAAIGTDAYSTVLRTNRQVETNRFLGRNPSRSSVVGLAVLSFTLQTTYHAACWHLTTGENDTKAWRIVGYTAIPTEVAIIYGGFGAIHNFHLEFPKLQAKDSMVRMNLKEK